MTQSLVHASPKDFMRGMSDDNILERMNHYHYHIKVRVYTWGS